MGLRRIFNYWLVIIAELSERPKKIEIDEPDKRIDTAT